MDINNANIEAIVKQVLANMTGSSAAPAAPAPVRAAGGAIPKTARVAFLTELGHFDIKEYPIPPVGDDDILVRVEGCGVCGTDA
ncbi:MAG: theronine dehydrogenase, partial [Blautia sp.]|nr:theronine dehydrogenase [Blautia sp.]